MAIVRHCLLFLIGIALLAIWLASAGANFAHGLQIAGYSPYWLVFGLASASADVLKAWVLVSGRNAWVQRRKGALVACALVWALTTAWGIRSCWGFIATTLSDTVSSRSMHGVADKSLLRQIDDQVERITKLQDAKIKAPPRDWDRIEGEIQRTEARLETLRKQARTTQAVGAADASSDLLVAWLGGTEKQVQVGTALLFMLLIEVCASLGFIAFAPMFTAEERGMVSEAMPEMQLPPAPPPLTPPHKGEGKEDRPLKLQAQELLRRLEYKYGEGQAIVTAEVFRLYRVLAEGQGWTPMTSTKLGQQLALLGVTRSDKDELKRVHYVLPTARERRESEKREGEKRTPGWRGNGPGVQGSG